MIGNPQGRHAILDHIVAPKSQMASKSKRRTYLQAQQDFMTEDEKVFHSKSLRFNRCS
jgi:hypothetical protein